jgi:thiamine-phosphate diphosphorylase
MLVTEPTPNLISIVSEAVTGGVTIIQWRQKALAKTNYYRSTYHSLTAVAQSTVPLVVNTPWEAIVNLGVKNVHFPEKSMSLPAARKELGAGALIGKSVHSVEAAVQAAKDGVDYLIAGTIFESSSHPGEEPAGVGLLESICSLVSIPVLAIGGVTPLNIESCIGAGAAGVAVLSPIMRSSNPCAIAQSYRSALDGAWSRK